MAANLSFFAPVAPIAGAKKTTVRSRFIGKIAYYTAPSEASESQMRDLAFLCALSFASIDATTPLDSVKSLIVTYTGLLFTDLVGRLSKDEYTSVELDQASVDQASGTIQKYYDTLEANPDADVSTAFGGMRLSQGLPAIPTTIAPGFVGQENVPKTLYCHYALVVFLAGKEISDLNRASITTARPKALIQKYKLTDTEILNGAWRISDVMHGLCNQAWAEQGTFRRTCFKEFGQYSYSDTDLGQDILATNVNLMKYSFMNHAVLISQLLRAYPWVSDIPALKQSVSIFNDHVIRAFEYPMAERPFIKLIYGDRSGLFSRKDFGPLIAVALQTQKEVQDTLANYYSDEKFAGVVEAFNTERDKRAKLSGYEESADHDEQPMEEDN